MRAILTAVLLALGAGTARSAPPDALDSALPAADLPFAAPVRVVALDTLAETRGGFQAGGMNIGFGIERAVYVNGQLTAHVAVSVTDLSQALAAARQQAPAGLAGLVPALVVQNTLGDQRLQAHTVVNAVLEASPLLNAARLELLVREATISGLRR